MNIKVKDIEKIKVVELSGDVDGKNAPAAQEQIMPLLKTNPKIILDMSGVGFMSSAGLRVLLSIKRQLAPTSQLVLVGLTEQIQDTMAITGFLDFFVVAPDLAHGIALIN